MITTQTIESIKVSKSEYWTPAGSGWYLFSYDGTLYAVLPNSSGVLQSVYLCGNLPSQTPTQTITPKPQNPKTPIN